MTKKMTNYEFITKAKIIHNEKYTYDKVDMKNRDEKGKVIITCPIHGDFKQMPYKHLQGNGCKKCANELDSKRKLKTNDKFIKDSLKKHSTKYSYDKINYQGNKIPIIITCPIHGDFEQTPDDHLQGKGCPKCGMISSKYEDEICNFINDDEIIRNSKKILDSGKEIDIYIPSKKIGIEFNGLRWHSELYNKDKFYHINKLKECSSKGIKLIQIFEDEYIHHKDIVFNKISHLLKIDLNKEKIMARKCEIQEINNKKAKCFLENFHIQGFASSTVYLGAFYDDALIGVMTFKKESNDCNKWELNRFASDYNYICQGVGGKLFKYFIKKYNPSEVKSFADKRWTLDKTNNLYLKLGFYLDKDLNPDYRYYDPNKDKTIRFHKFLYRKQKLNKLYNLPLTMTENEMTKELGCYKIWDCGLYRFIWKKRVD